jgi:hypothetical protein
MIGCEGFLEQGRGDRSAQWPASPNNLLRFVAACTAEEIEWFARPGDAAVRSLGPKPDGGVVPASCKPQEICQ